MPFGVILTFAPKGDLWELAFTLLLLASWPFRKLSEKSGLFFANAPHQTVQLGGFQKGGIPPFAKGIPRWQRRPLAFKKFSELISEIHSWPETPEMESWHLVPLEKSQVAVFPCAGSM